MPVDPPQALTKIVQTPESCMEVASAARAVDREALSRGVIPADIAIARAPKRKNPTECNDSVFNAHRY